MCTSSHQILSRKTAKSHWNEDFSLWKTIFCLSLSFFKQIPNLLIACSFVWVQEWNTFTISAAFYNKSSTLWNLHYKAFGFRKSAKNSARTSSGPTLDSALKTFVYVKRYGNSNLKKKRLDRLNRHTLIGKHVAK